LPPVPAAAYRSIGAGPYPQPSHADRGRNPARPRVTETISACPQVGEQAETDSRIVFDFSARFSYLCPPPPPDEPCPPEALPADDAALVPEETELAEEETELVEVDIAPEYPDEVCDMPL